MTSKDLKQLFVRQLPQLRKPWFGGDPIIYRDGDYPEIEKEAGSLNNSVTIILSNTASL